MTGHAEVLAAGAPLEQAEAAVILLHGRGATAQDILGLADALGPSNDHSMAWIAPQAPGNTWYPHRFLEDVDVNEPHRTRALTRIDSLIGDALAAGVSDDRIGIAGFSQGACLALEYAAFGTARAAFVGALSGGVMGPLHDTRNIEGSRSDMRVFIGCGDRDGHIPLAHAERSARLLTDAGANVDFRAYPGMGHSINDDELTAVRALLSRLTSAPTGNSLNLNRPNP